MNKETVVTSLILVAVVIITGMMCWNNLLMKKRLYAFEFKYSPRTETAIPMPERIHYVKAPTTA